MADVRTAVTFGHRQLVEDRAHLYWCEPEGDLPGAWSRALHPADLVVVSGCECSHVLCEV